jgi:hypothetical protein
VQSVHRVGVVVVLLAALLAACAAPSRRTSNEVVSIRDWTLVTALGASPVTLPAHLNDRLPPGPSRYTLRSEVPLPSAFEGEPLTLAITHLPALVTLRVNGHQAVELDTSPFDRYRSSGPHVWRVVAEETHRPTIELELEVEHNWVASGWVDWVPALSATPAGDARFVAVTTFNRVSALAAMVTMLLVSFLYGVIFLVDRGRTVHAWHAAQGIFAAFYPALLLGYLQPMFGMNDVMIAALAIIVAAVCSVHFVAGLLGLPTPSRAWWLLVAAGLVTSPLAVGHFHANAIAPAVVAALVSVSGYGVVAFLRARRNGPLRLGTAVAALGFPIASVLGVPDAIALLGGGDVMWGIRASSLAIGGLSLLEAIVLSRNHSASLKRTDQLNEQLQARVALLEANNREIGVLNEELRRQVGARSQHLADALSRLGPVLARPRELVAGDVVDERYRVVRRIGEGGMGTVYEVERAVDGRRLALKVLQGYRSGAELARLAREAEIAARVDHPNVVGMVDVDVSASGAVYVVMEYVDGDSLDALTERYGDAAWALGLLRQIAGGLAVMHAEDIVHRDLKPGNVLVTRSRSGEEVAKIADFGIATLGGSIDETTAPLDDVAHARTVLDSHEAAPFGGATGGAGSAGATTDRNLTRTGQILGTPLYMAPELARGAKNASPASDMYAVGVMAFEILTGALPSGYERLDHLRGGRGSAPEFAKRSPGLAPRVAAVLERCLAPEPAARPTARELADALSC